MDFLLFYLFSFVLGLALGSFAYVCYGRLPAEKSLFTRSECEHCHHQLGISDLIPLWSVLLRRGHCRFCHYYFGYRYLIPELVFGLLCLSQAIKSGPTPEIFLLWAFWFSLTLLAWIDFSHLFFPPRLLLLAYIFAGLDLYYFHPQQILEQLQAMAALVSFFFLIRFLFLSLRKKESLGEGDIALFGALGLLFPWESLPSLVFFSALLAILGILARKIFFRTELSAPFPYGPSIVLSSFWLWLFPRFFLSFFQIFT